MVTVMSVGIQILQYDCVLNRSILRTRVGHYLLGSFGNANGVLFPSRVSKYHITTANCAYTTVNTCENKGP